MFEHLLVPLDGSALAEDVLPVVESIGTRLGARVTLLHVLERDAPASVHGESHITDAAEGARYLGEVADRLQRSGVEVDIHVHARSVEDVVAAIDAHAHEFGIDLIAMCKHGRTGWRQKLMGGIAQQLLRGGGTPILLRSPREHPSKDDYSVRRILVPLEPRHDADAALVTAGRLASAYEAQVQTRGGRDQG
jgi:nucleotide-binding universal stress UspA family protein